MTSGNDQGQTLRVGPGGPALVCPHCDMELEVLIARELLAGGGAFGFGRRWAYACPHCRKVLGVSHRKGFWMG